MKIQQEGAWVIGLQVAQPRIPSGQLRLQNLTVNETDGDDNYNNYLLLELIKCQ